MCDSVTSLPADRVHQFTATDVWSALLVTCKLGQTDLIMMCDWFFYKECFKTQSLNSNVNIRLYLIIDIKFIFDNRK